mmetsp:Transcript_32197/g.68139  ORF Transcript_32197/g.68139 Transcript_32197/m.68139 type:complete len:88 (+) Transcript_32197:1710-1973(+)
MNRGVLVLHADAMAATAAEEDDGTTTADGANGALLAMNADAKAGPLLPTARRIPADEMKRSISCVDTMNIHFALFSVAVAKARRMCG